MKLNYFELLSPDPIYIPKVGSILSPTLKDVRAVGHNTYQFYQSVLLMDVKAYFTMLNQAEQFEALSEEQRFHMNIFDLLTSNEQTAVTLQNTLDFFIKEQVTYSSQQKCFLVSDNENVVGVITKEIYPQVCDLICQRNYIKFEKQEDLSKIKNKKALEIMKKVFKGREGNQKKTKVDKNMELGNIISAVANKSQSLNILNIWNLTVFQVWDCFSRLSNNAVYDIQSMSVATWGDQDKQFDATSWFKQINTDN